MDMKSKFPFCITALALVAVFASLLVMPVMADSHKIVIYVSHSGEPSVNTWVQIITNPINPEHYEAQTDHKGKVVFTTPASWTQTTVFGINVGYIDRMGRLVWYVAEASGSSDFTLDRHLSLRIAVTW